MSKKLIYSALSEQGLRDNNEDLLVACPISNDCYLFICIDGIGGENGGEVAASIAASSIQSYLYDTPKADLNELRMAVTAANNNIIEMQKNPHVAHMGCVLTACIINTKTGMMHISHVGDTRLYTLQSDSGSLIKQTKDDSFVGQLFDQGLISEEEAMTHPKRNRINKCLGAKPLTYFSDYLYTTSISIDRIQSVLLCSDGLYDVVSSKEIRMVLSDSGSPETNSKELVEMAMRNRSHDNISVICININNL